jgi:hypothetical protein
MKYTRKSNGKRRFGKDDWNVWDIYDWLKHMESTSQMAARLWIQQALIRYLT